MKKLFIFGKLMLLFAGFLGVSSCATKPPVVTDLTPRFTDDASINAVLQFSSWEYTFLIRPQYLEGGYLQQVHRESLGKVLDKMQVRRGTVAVVVGVTYKGEVLDSLVSEWKTILGGCGFQRVVILRAQFGNNLNGSEIIDDSVTHVGFVQGAPRGG